MIVIHVEMRSASNQVMELETCREYQHMPKLMN